MKAFLKFIKISIFVIAVLVIGFFSFAYYTEQTLDDTALSCFSANENKHTSFMLRKRPFNDNYVGLYVSPINDEKFNKLTKLEDLYMIGYHRESSKNFITFEHRNTQTVSINLDRVTLDMKVKDAFKGILNQYKCNIIDHKKFYNSIRDTYNKEKNKLKV
tara:strand:- start:81 stop:560 length:480 start_codon:yes stop_codon:yes gene_type:complete